MEGTLGGSSPYVHCREVVLLSECMLWNIIKVLFLENSFIGGFTANYSVVTNVIRIWEINILSHASLSL